jgi:hypothetical protein
MACGLRGAGTTDVGTTDNGAARAGAEQPHRPPGPANWRARDWCAGGLKEAISNSNVSRVKFRLLLDIPATDDENF